MIAGSPSAVEVSRTGASTASSSSAGAARARRQRRAVATAASASSGGPNSVPSRAALPPIGLSTTNATRQASAYRTTPARSARSSRGTSASHGAANSRIGHRVRETRNARRPARGTAAASASVRAAGATAATTQRVAAPVGQRHGAGRPGPGTGPATGLPMGHSAATRPTRQDGPPALERRAARRSADRHAEREGQAAGEQADGGGGAEPGRAQPGALPVALVAPAARTGLPRPRGQRAHQARPEQPGQRREQDAVAGGVVAGEPLAVPDREAELLEQARAKQLGGQVRAGRLPDQVQRAAPRPRARRLAARAAAWVAGGYGARSAVVMRSGSGDPSPVKNRQTSIGYTRGVEPGPVAGSAHELELGAGQHLSIRVGEAQVGM